MHVRRSAVVFWFLGTSNGDVNMRGLRAVLVEPMQHPGTERNEISGV